MLGSPAGPGGHPQRSLWPLAPAPTATSFTTDGFSKCGVYSLFPGGPSFGSAIYTHARTIGQFTSGHIQPSTGNPFHHKDSLFSSAGYMFGAPTPPPGSPYSPVPMTQLELLSKGFNSNIIIQQQDYPLSPKKIQIQEKRCDEKCCNLKLQKSCNCQLGSPVNNKKFMENGSGCSRTNPIEWSGVNVKKEPGATPCQVAEITTSVSPIVKLEVTSPRNGHEHVNQNNHCVGSGGNSNSHANNIPIGITVARQRFHEQEVVGSPSLPPAGLLTTVNAAAQMKEVARISEIESTTGAAGMAAGPTGGGAGGGGLLQCTDERNGTLAGWPMGGGHSSALTTPTLWQYPAPVPMEPMVPLPVPMPPVGFQLVRDPTTGGLLLLPATGIEPLQQALVWPSYQQPPVLLPPLPPPPLQLLSSASSDYLSSSTTLHQHTQTHSTRLVAVTTDNKRKIPLPIPTTTFIKIETDATTLDQTKTLQAVSTIASNTGTVFTDQPLVTTHVIYQHPTNLILSQPTSEAICRSQATSPVSCLTPPPEINSIQEEEPLAVQDASNQTDTPICSEDDSTIHEIEKKHHHQEEIEKIETPVITQVPEELSKTVEPEQVQEVSSLEETQQQKPDISGLELLSNSIVEFEICRNNVKIEPNSEVLTGIAHMTLKDCDNEPVISQPVGDNFGGLDLLCALAEQRIMEENVEKHKERKKEKRKSRKHPDEPKRKKSKHHGDNHKSKKRRDSSDSDRKSLECYCRDEDYRSYKSPESEEEVRKFIASKTHGGCCKGDWPYMNEMELDMRMKLADLQRQYREKQKELSKLKPKKQEKRTRKKSTHSERSLATPPPLLDKVEILKPKCMELLKPPTLCPVETVKTPKLEAIKQSDRIINDYKNDLLRQRALEEIESSPEKNSSSKKRKVGRPKKLSPSPSGFHSGGTETIVAKKPKSSFVGYLLAAKEKLQSQTKFHSNSPPRYVEDTKVKTKKNKNNNNIIIEEVKSKIRPKLKAQATVKAYEDRWDSPDEGIRSDGDETDELREPEEIATEPEVVREPDEVIAQPETRQVDNKCILTSEHLEIDKLRVLTAMGGLFYAGHLNPVQPPDIYSITLDGERGNRPHIMSREEILRDAIVEVSPKSTDELVSGTRIVAYWSQQYRCLYPGTVAEPGTPDPALDSKFVAVEFDDDDSGRIALEDIRLLPPDYPIIGEAKAFDTRSQFIKEYDPNPLLSLSKRRRRNSTSTSTEERRQTVVVARPPPLPSIPQEPTKSHDLDVEKENKDTNKPDVDSHKERKRLKKKKREKLKQKMLHEDKKKKKKHKCTDEFCKHKKHHKKHKKHKKRHHYLENKVQEEMQQHLHLQVEIQDQSQEIDAVVNPEDEVTMDDIYEATQSKQQKLRDRQESCESRSKMSAFLPARQLWSWSGKGYKRPKAKGRARKQFYRNIQRGKETITVGDSAVFLSTGRPDRPYIGKIQGMWELCGKMVVKIKWFYHPEETIGCPSNLQYPGALFESSHEDENDVQTIAHKCEVLPLKEYIDKLGDDPQRYEKIYDNNDIYYLAGSYDPTTPLLKIQPDIPFKSD